MMVTKMNSKRVIPNTQDPSVRIEEPESDIASSSENVIVLGITEQLPFFILDET